MNSMTQETSRLALVPVSVQEKGQVTLSRELRRRLNLKKGDLVTFVETPEGFVIKPAAAVANDALDDIGQALKARRIKLKDVLEHGREIRSELTAEKYGLPQRSRAKGEKKR